MKKSLIKEEVNEILNELVGKFFEFNRLLDRQMSVLDVKFTMKNTASVLHPLLAHKMPLFADDISEYQGSRNALTIYPQTPEGSDDYSHPIEIFESMLSFQLSIEESISEAIVFSKNAGDMVTHSFLIDFLEEMIVYTNQFSLLYDRFEKYAQSEKYWMDFDCSISKLVIL